MTDQMHARARRVLVAVAGALAGGAGLGFVARDLLGLGQPLVALTWVAGALAVAAGGKGRPHRPPGRF